MLVDSRNSFAYVLGGASISGHLGIERLEKLCSDLLEMNDL